MPAGKTGRLFLSKRSLVTGAGAFNFSSISSYKTRNIWRAARFAWLLERPNKRIRVEKQKKKRNEHSESTEEREWLVKQLQRKRYVARDVEAQKTGEKTKRGRRGGPLGSVGTRW